jgi:hypothetical protein
LVDGAERATPKSIHTIKFPQKNSWQREIKVLNTSHGRAGPVLSARLCASYEKHADKDFSPFGYPGWVDLKGTEVVFNTFWWVAWPSGGSGWSEVLSETAGAGSPA